MRHDVSLFGDPVTPGQRLVSLEAFLPLAAIMAGDFARREAVLVALDRQWRVQRGVTVVADVPSVPELLATLLALGDGGERSPRHLLGMERVICLSTGVPFRTSPDADWRLCDALTTEAGVVLVEWIALDPGASVLPRVQAAVEPRWPLPD